MGAFDTFDLDLFNLDKPGWCTPTILVTVVGVLSILLMTAQLIRNRDQSKLSGLVSAWVLNLVWTLLIIAFMFWMCSRGKVDVSWWAFGLLYLVPLSLFYFGVLFWLYKQESPSMGGMAVGPAMAPAVRENMEAAMQQPEMMDYQDVEGY